MHRIADDRRSTSRRSSSAVGLTVAAIAAIAAVLALAAGLAVGAAPAAAACSGRSLLTCAEKQQTSGDVLISTYAFRLDSVPFETRTPLRLSDRGLRAFWAFETSAAAARSMYELLLVLQGTDPDFESIATVTRLPVPTVPRSRAVGRPLARILERLMRAEQDEIGALQGLVVSMDRATEASAGRGRSDWMRWQLAAAASFASRAGRALGRVISAQRTASHALLRRRLRFGIGSVDVRLARRQVRRHGLARTLKSAMAALAMSPDLIAACANELRGTAPPGVSINLSQLLASATTVQAERAFQGALTHFAARTPRASRPPS